MSGGLARMAGRLKAWAAWLAAAVAVWGVFRLWGWLTVPPWPPAPGAYHLSSKAGAPRRPIGPRWRYKRGLAPEEAVPLRPGEIRGPSLREFMGLYDDAGAANPPDAIEDAGTLSPRRWKLDPAVERAIPPLPGGDGDPGHAHARPAGDETRSRPLTPIGPTEN